MPPLNMNSVRYHESQGYQISMSPRFTVSTPALYVGINYKSALTRTEIMMLSPFHINSIRSHPLTTPSYAHQTSNQQLSAFSTENGLSVIHQVYRPRIPRCRTFAIHQASSQTSHASSQPYCFFPS